MKPLFNPSIEINTRELCHWVFYAGKIALHYFDRIKLYPHSPDENPAGQADREIEQYLARQLQISYPDYCVIGEEHGPFKDNAATKMIWTIDPLDGTTVFNQGMPEWGIAIGLLMYGRPVFGMFYMPATQEMYYTGRDGHVCDIFGRSLLWSVRQNWGHKGFVATTASAHANYHLNIPRTRAPGSVGVNLVYAARGTAAAAFLPKPCLWDLVPGAALLAPAGGVVRYLSGHPLDYTALLNGQSSPEPVLAGSSSLLDELQSKISSRTENF
ncbi:MAG: inositol monophosphatase [Anaerolineae bacterium]|nr:inositol monophosphatase [Anaerolineae bacterium]